MTIRLTLSLDLDSDTSTELIDAYIAGVRNIARALFNVDVDDSYIERGELNEPVRRIDSVGNDVGINYWRGVQLPDSHRHNDLRTERGVAGVRSSAPGGHRLRAASGPGVAEGEPGPESGSDRLSGLPEGTMEDDTGEIMASHRGRRRRLWDELKKVGAGRRFRR